MKNPALPAAPVWRRLAALLYDSFILLAISFFYGAIVTAVGTVAGRHEADYQPMFDHWAFTLGWVLVLVAFYMWFWHKSGQTIGMRTWRLKLVERDNPLRTPSWQLCALRALVAPPAIVFGGLGYWYALIDRQAHCLHDRLSKTQVIELPKES
jgi:uncharacterized RDD family membrane protein YckC